MELEVEGEIKCVRLCLQIQSGKNTLRERTMMRQWWCKTSCVRRHILDRLLVSSCRTGILTVFTFSEGNALAHSCTPNKQSCIYRWQDNTQLIWTCSSFLNKSGPSDSRQLCNTESLGAHLNKNVHTLKADTLPLTPTFSWLHFLCQWCHSLGSFFADVGANPIKSLRSNQH